MKDITDFKFNIRRDSTDVLYIQFKEQLRANIQKLKLKSGTRLPDLESLAAEAGVSVKTAYKGLSELINENVCFRRPKKGTFVADIKKTPSFQKSVCCIYHKYSVADLEKNLIFGPIYRGIQQEAAKHEIDLVFLNGDPVDSLELYLENKKIRFIGVIMLEWDSYKEGIRLAHIYPNTRFIYLNYHDDSFETTPRNIFGIFNDEFSGAFQAAEYIASQNHQTVGLVSLELSEDNYRRRTEGFKMGLKDNGYKLEEQLLEVKCAPAEDQTRTLGNQLAAKLFHSSNPPSAVFAVNDLLILGVLDYLKKNNIEDKVELIGYDNIFPNISSDNKFSTVAVDFFKMGKRAVNILCGHAAYCSKSIYLNPQLLLRQNH